LTEALSFTPLKPAGPRRYAPIIPPRRGHRAGKKTNPASNHSQAGQANGKAQKATTAFYTASMAIRFRLCLTTRKENEYRHLPG
jgi:hypothetical protein